jgi:hypothetical protein
MLLSAAAVMGLVMNCMPQAPVIQQQFPELLAMITQVKIGKHESGYNTLAIHNNTTGQSLYPLDIEHAQAYVADHQGDSLDAGLMQINYTNWQRFGLNNLNVFDPQTNACVGLQIFREALSRYNTGRVTARGLDYAEHVLNANIQSNSKPSVSKLEPQAAATSNLRKEGFGVEKDDEFADSNQKVIP